MTPPCHHEGGIPVATPWSAAVREEPNMPPKIDGAGRIVIPAAIRRAFGLGSSGGELELVDTPDGVLLRPVELPQR